MEYYCIVFFGYFGMLFSKIYVMKLLRSSFVFNMVGKNLMRDKEVIKRMETNKEGNSFNTIKDHKENFDNHPTVWLVNPAKKELGRISILSCIEKCIYVNE